MTTATTTADVSRPEDPAMPSSMPLKPAAAESNKPKPLNYAPPGHRPYPKSICTSVNHQVCHGVPGDKVLRNGDIVNIDITVIKDGWHGDTSRMFYVGDPSVQARRLCDVTYECMWKGIDQVRPGATLGDIGFAIQKHAEANGFSVDVASGEVRSGCTRSGPTCALNIAGVGCAGALFSATPDEAHQGGEHSRAANAG